MMMDDRMTRIRVLVGNGWPLPNELARDLLRARCSRHQIGHFVNDESSEVHEANPISHGYGLGGLHAVHPWMSGLSRCHSFGSAHIATAPKRNAMMSSAMMPLMSPLNIPSNTVPLLQPLVRGLGLSLSKHTLLHVGQPTRRHAANRNAPLVIAQQL